MNLPITVSIYETIHASIQVQIFFKSWYLVQIYESLYEIIDEYLCESFYECIYQTFCEFMHASV